MYEYYFTFRSVTTAARAQKALERVGIAAGMSRAPKPLRQNGCGYAVQVRGRELNQAKTAMTGAGVQWLRLYRRTGEQFREVVG